MVYIPQRAMANIMSFLHRAYDFERLQVINELKDLCTRIRGADPELIPVIMLQHKCKWQHIKTKYRMYSNRASESKCVCGYCRRGLWGIY